MQIILAMNATLFLLGTMTLPIFAANRSEPVPLYGSYTRTLDRSKQTFNHHINANSRPQKQKETFFTVCKKSACIAHTPNLYAPAGSPKFIDYHWINNRWELKAAHNFHCNDGSTINAILSEFMIPIGNGNFTGERRIIINAPGCPGEGPGIYRLPFRLTPN